MEVLQKLGVNSEHDFDMLTLEEIKGLENFGPSALRMVNIARGLRQGTGIDLKNNPDEVESLIFGESKIDDGLVELNLNLRIPARRLDWLQRLSALYQEANPQRKEAFTVEGLVVKFINDARRMDSSDAGRRTQSTTQQR